MLLIMQTMCETNFSTTFHTEIEEVKDAAAADAIIMDIDDNYLAAELGPRFSVRHAYLVEGTKVR